jgi:glyoxylase-like metal-dependent hydrolase (beta-lactamase superfamily II)
MTPIPFVHEPPPPYGVTERLSPLVRRVMCDNPGPFTYRGTGTFIVGEGEVAVIDPGPDDPAHLAALTRALEGERVTAILTTHTHGDHSPLAHPLQAAVGGVIHGLPDPGADTGEIAPERLFRPDETLHDGVAITGPGWTLEPVFTPGHASNHMAFALPEEDTLFSGDHVMGWSTTIVSPPDGRMGDYLASLDRVIARGFSRLRPCHGPAVEDPAPFLAAYRAHRLEREAQVMAQLAAGRARIADMVADLYAAVDPRLHPAAARSLWAHLIHLVETGRAVADGAPTLDAAYAPA